MFPVDGLIVSLLYVSVVVGVSQALRDKKESAVDRPPGWWGLGMGISVVLSVGLYAINQTSIRQALPSGTLSTAGHLTFSLVLYFGALLAQRLNTSIDASSFAGLLAGASFYFGRELAQTEIGNDIWLDWKGLLAPLLGCAALFVALHLTAKDEGK